MFAYGSNKGATEAHVSHAILLPQLLRNAGRSCKHNTTQGPRRAEGPIAGQAGPRDPTDRVMIGPKRGGGLMQPARRKTRGAQGTEESRGWQSGSQWRSRVALCRRGQCLFRFRVAAPARWPPDGPRSGGPLSARGRGMGLRAIGSSVGMQARAAAATGPPGPIPSSTLRSRCEGFRERRARLCHDGPTSHSRPSRPSRSRRLAGEALAGGCWASADGCVSGHRPGPHTAGRPP